MFIPGQLVALATFPGVIVHEIAHQFFCRVFRVAVFDVCYFQVANPAGYVQFEPPRATSHHILIGVGPFVVNSVLGALIAFPAAIPVLQFQSGNPLDYLLIWLGVSIAMHAFPSTGDAASIWQALHGESASWLAKLIGTPVVGAIYLGALGSRFWLDLVYGIGIAGLAPRWLATLLA